MNNKNDLVTKILELDKEDKEEEIEKLLEDKLKEDPKNIDLWIRLAVLELDHPFHDEERGMECVDEVLKIEKDHPIALLLKAYIQDRTFGLDKKLTDKLSSLVTNSDEINSMLRCAASWYYKKKGDFNRAEQLLIESISFYKGHVWNYVRLAVLCFKKGQDLEAKELVKKALKNVQKVYTIEEWEPDPTDVNELFYEFFTGIQLTDYKFKNIKDMLDK